MGMSVWRPFFVLVLQTKKSPPFRLALPMQILARQSKYAKRNLVPARANMPNGTSYSPEHNVSDPHCSFQNRFQYLHPCKPMPLLVEVVEILAFGEFLFEVVVVAKEFIIGGEGEVE